MECTFLSYRVFIFGISRPARSYNPESINNNVNNCLFDRSFRSKNDDKIIKVFKINNWNDLITERERERERENINEKYLNGGRNIHIIINGH